MDMTVLWYLLVGALLILMALLSGNLQRLPVSGAIVYLTIGMLLGPAGLDYARLDPLRESRLLETITEIAVLTSLFNVGLKLREDWGSLRWRPPLLLATAGMIGTIGLMAVAGVMLWSMSWGAAVLLGAILAPTDPVLASEVQVREPGDRSRLRFTLSAEGGLNDGTAFPFVVLGLGLLGVHPLGEAGLRWLGVDLLWAVGAGLACGWLVANIIGRALLRLRDMGDSEGAATSGSGYEQFMAAGLMALTYGISLGLHAYGFLAVFIAGFTLHVLEYGRNVPYPSAAEEPTGPATTTVPSAAARVPTTQTLLTFNEQLERLLEFAVVLGLGIMLSSGYFDWRGVSAAAVLLLLIRPLVVALTLWAGSKLKANEISLTCWFGVRGIGSIYYLVYAINHGLSPALAQTLAGPVLTLLATSIVVHGISATPLMQRHDAQRTARGGRSI